MSNTEKTALPNLSAVEDLHALLKPGDRLVLALPAGSALLPSLSSLLEKTVPHPAKSLLVTGQPEPEGSSIRSLSLSDSKTLQEALTRIKRQASAHTVLVHGVCPFGAWEKKPAHFLEFFEKASKFFEQSRARSIWLFPRDRFPDEIWSAIKDEAEFFLTALTAGSTTLLQFITAKKVFTPEFFLPRRVVFDGPNVTFEDPTLPATGTGGESVDLLQQSYRRAFGAAADGMVLLDVMGTYREPNERACEILGYPDAELRSARIRDLVAPGSYRSVLRAFLLLRRKGRTSLDVSIRRKSGREATIAVNASNAGYGQIIVLLRDATAERRERELLSEEKNLLQARVNGVPYPQARFAGRRLVSVNPALHGLFTWLKLEEENMPTLLQFFGKQNQDVARDVMRLLDQREAPFTEKRNIRLRHPDGAWMELDLTVDSTSIQGKVETCLTFVDTTELHKTIRQHEDAAMNFKGLMESSALAFAVVRDGRYIFANRGFVALLGFDAAGDLVGQEFTVSVGSRDRKSVMHKLTEAAPSTGELLAFEFSAVRKDGTRTRMDAQCTPVDYEGQTALLVSCRDIGGTLKSTEEVRRRLDDVETVERIIVSVRSLRDPVAVASSALDGCLKALGFEAGGMYLPGVEAGSLKLSDQRALSENVLKAIGEQNIQEGVTGFIARTLEPLVLSVQDYPAHIPYKSLFEAEHFATVIYLPLVAGDELQGIMLLCSGKAHDAEVFGTTLLPALVKALGSALRSALDFQRISDSEQTFRSAFEGIPDVVYISSPAGAFLYLAPQIEALSGFGAGDFTGNPDLWRSSLHPDDRVGYSGRISNQHSGVDRHEMLYRFLPKGKAAYRWMRDAYQYIRDANGSVVSIDGIISDVTERMESAAGTMGAAGQAQDVLESVQEGVIVLDKDLRFTVWNRTMAQLTGISQAEMIGKKAAELPAGHPMESLRDLLGRALEGEQVSQDDLTIVHGDETHYIWGRSSPLRDAGGVIVGVAATLSDVTSRKYLELELRESEETLRNVIDGMGDALMISDLQGKIWEVNREFSQITGYPRGEVLRIDFPYPWIVDEEMANFVAWIAALREKKSLRDFDMTWKRKDGRKVSISLSTTLLRTAAGEPMAMLNLARDITERKQLTNELSAKNRQIEMLNRIISKANTTVDFATIFDIIGVEVLNLFSYDLIFVSLLTEDTQRVRLFGVMSPGIVKVPVGDLVPLERSICKVAIESKSPVVVGDIPSDHRFSDDLHAPLAHFKSLISIPIVLNDRILGAFNIASLAENQFTGVELAVLQPIADQIGALVDRTLLFQRVSDDSKYIHTLLNSIDSVVLTVDPELRIREANKAWREFAALLGLEQLQEESSITGRSAREILRVPGLWDELQRSVPQVFDQSVEYVTREFDLEREGATRIFQLTVTPLLIGEKVTGLVFTITDITESKKTEAEIKQRNRELLALNAINSSITKSLNTGEVLSVALGHVRDIAGAELVLCYLRESPTGMLRLARAVGLPEALSAEVRHLDESGSALGAVVSAGQPLLINDHPSTDERLTPAGRRVLEALGIQSFVAIPLLSKERVLGTLGVGFGHEHPITEQEQSFLMLIGSQLGAAIENAQLYAEVQAQVQRITSLYELGKGLSGAIDTQSLLNVVHGEVAKTLPFDLFSYDLYHESTGRFERVFSTGQQNGDTFQTVAMELPLAVQNSVKQGLSYFGNTDVTGAVLAVPVLSKEQIFGVLSVYKKPADSYEEAHLRLLESIANLTGIAIDRAVLYEDTVAKSLEIENRNKELDDFTYVVSHDLKEPLITIEGYSKIVLKEYQDRVDEEGKAYLSAVVQSTARMKSLIDDLLTLSRLGRLAEAPHAVSVKSVLSDVLHDFEFTLREKNAVITAPERLPEVTYDGTQLSMVFRNLISNAIKFNAGPEPRVQLGVQEDEREYVFSVADNGIGIEKQHFDKIFVIFQRLHRSEEYRGTGAGLTIVKKIVERHHGRIWVESEVGKGTTFFFTVPK